MSTLKKIIGNLPNFTVKPKSISELGVVTFTDGTNDVIPNQLQCEAYGYTYEVLSGTCRIFQQNTNIDNNVNNTSNQISGVNNISRTGSNNSLILGENNVNYGRCRNNFITGSRNEIESNVNNAAAFGINASVINNAALAVGGGLNNIRGLSAFYADRQMQVLQLSGYTTNNTATKLTLNGNNVDYIQVKRNSIIGWEVFLTRLEVGGSSGTAGNFSYRLFQGCTVVDNSYDMTFTTGFTRNIAKSGVNGSFSMVKDDASGQMTVQVTDRNNVNNIWNAIIYLHELTSTNITF